MTKMKIYDRKRHCIMVWLDLGSRFIISSSIVLKFEKYRRKWFVEFNELSFYQSIDLLRYVVVERKSQQSNIWVKVDTVL